MQTREIAVKERNVYANGQDMTLVRTSIGTYQMHVLFDDAEWLDFPVRVTFGNGETTRTQTLTLAAVTSSIWAAESTCTIPWEVMETLNSVTLTFYGTDNSSNHIITAYGAPLSVVEAGGVGDGTVPEAAPTVDEYTQAYNNAVLAANDAASAAAQISEILGSTDADTLEELLVAYGAAMRYQGVVASASDLPESPDAGETYIVGGVTEVYDGSAWVELTVDLSAYATTSAMTTALSAKADLASPALTGTPTAPTATTGDDSTTIATTAFVQQEIAAALASLTARVTALENA